MDRDTIPAGDVQETSYDEEGAAQAFLEKWKGEQAQQKDAKRPSDAEDEDATSGASDEEQDPEDEDDAEGSEEDREDAAEDDEGDAEEEDGEKEEKLASDDLEVIVTVDGVEKRASVKDLKRLYGQEAALTRKSQETAERRKAADETHQRYATALNTMIESAQREAQPYAQIDWLVAAQKLTPEELQALRNEAKQKIDRVNFLGQELDKTIKDRQAIVQKQLVDRAKEAIEVFRDEKSPYHIPNWTPDTYKQLRDYAVTAGIEPGVMDSIVDAAPIKLIYKAMLYDRGREKVKSAKPKAKATAKRTATQSDTNVGERSTARDGKAMERLLQTGDAEDAAAVFLARIKAGKKAQD